MIAREDLARDRDELKPSLLMRVGRRGMPELAFGQQGRSENPRTAPEQLIVLFYIGVVCSNFLKCVNKTLSLLLERLSRQ